MKKTDSHNKKLLGELQNQLKKLQVDLVEAHKREGKDPYIVVAVKKTEAHFERVRVAGEEDKAFGKFFLEVAITAKQADVFIPLSVASGKKVAGFMYQIEGTAQGSVVSTDIKVRGDSIMQVTVGTLLYAKIPTGKTASFRVYARVRGRFGKIYKLVFTRLNYKLQVADLRYQQYLKELHSDSVTLR